jgi:flagellar biosynthesis protein FlhG
MAGHPVKDQAAGLRLLRNAAHGPGAAMPSANGDLLSPPRRLAATRPDQVIAVASGKGGVGKSNIALNLAIELSHRGRPSCLLDADLGLANASILAGVTPKRTLGHLLRGEARIEEILTRGPMNLGIISGCMGVAAMADLSAEDRQRLLKAFSFFDRRWEYLVLDLGAGIAANVIDFLERADRIIVVTTPEPPAMADAFGLVKALAERKSGKRISVVVNRAASITEARRTAERFADVALRYLDQTVDWGAFIMEDALVRKAVQERRPFSAFARSSRPARSIALLADRIETGRAMEDENVDAPIWRGWIERLFG